MRVIELIARARARAGRRYRQVRRRVADRAQDVRARAWSFVLREERSVPPDDDVERARRDREVDEASEESFPASDPPSWTSRGPC